MKSLTTSIFVILTLTILGVNSSGLTNSARLSSAGLAAGSRGLSNVAQSAVAAAATSIVGTLDVAAPALASAISAACAKATADVQAAATKEKAAIDAALAAMKGGFLQIEGCIEISVNAAEAAKALTSSVKTRLVSAIDGGAEKIQGDVAAGVASLNVALQAAKEKTIADALEGAEAKRAAIQEAVQSLVMNMRREAFDGIGYNAIVADGAAINDVLASRATVMGSNLRAGRRIAGVQALPLAGLGASMGMASHAIP
ncbi:uncharacterized protein LOC123297988 [Chrysoperla carnea]|uniref:uncharacterized protein LOC123297988 n=1 Tax=Chrysoperla carnea TaxID=189513 RepID=UPI001D093601|nr:uncharacterized protein LOC123297988 [Chrysoperla carnea]